MVFPAIVVPARSPPAMVVMAEAGEVRRWEGSAELEADWKERNRQRNKALSLLAAPDVNRSFRDAASADPIAKRTSSDQKSPTPDHDSARDRYIRGTSGENPGSKLSRDEYIRKTLDQDNDRKDRDPDRER